MSDLDATLAEALAEAGAGAGAVARRRQRAWDAALLLVAALVLALAYALDGVAPRERAPDRAARVEREQVEARGWAQARRAGPVDILRAGAPFVLGAASGRVSGEACGAAASEPVAALIARELARYPAGALERAGLRRVVLCERLEQERLRVPSLPNVEGALLLDVDGDEAYLRRLLHHEVFHFLDHADDGRLGDDAAWSALNAPTFRYGEGGRSLRTPGAARFDPGVPGFVTLYATSGAEEDKAEVFSLRVTAPTGLTAMAARDAVVAAKAGEIERRVEGFHAGLLAALDATR